MGAKVVVSLTLVTAFSGALLFGAAGTVRWVAGWLYLVLFFGGTLALTLSLARRDPALLAERMKPPMQRGQPLWDKVLLAGLQLGWCVWMALLGLTVRFGWPAVPGWLQWIGGAGCLASFWMIGRVFRENTYLAPVVRIQRERGQQVISTGPYAVVRHPLYAAALVLFVSTSLMLGSWYGLAGAAVLGAAVAVRAVMEERELRRGLAGYAEYAQRMRYRLAPYVW